MKPLSRNESTEPSDYATAAALLQNNGSFYNKIEDRALSSMSFSLTLMQERPVYYESANSSVSLANRKLYKNSSNRPLRLNAGSRLKLKD